MRIIKIKGLDIVIILILITISFLPLVFFFRTEEPSLVRVTYDKGTRYYPIDEDADFVIESNGYSLSITIADSSVYVFSSTCPDLICVKTGTIRKTGQTIVCVPANLSVCIVGEGEYDGFAG